MLDDTFSNHNRGMKFFSLPERPEKLWDPPSLLLKEVMESFSFGIKRPERDPKHPPQSFRGE